MTVTAVSIRPAGPDTAGQWPLVAARAAITGAWPPDVLNDLLTADAKTTGAASATAGGVRARSSNATWHPAIAGCPGSSAGCRADCYAWRLERTRANVRDAAYRRLATWDAAVAAGDGPELAAALMRHVRADAEKRGILPTFRLHASGDFHSAGYVDAWREGAALVAADDAPPLRVWTYSRSYGSAGRELVGRLLDDDGRPPAGWTLYLSTDDTMTTRTANAVRGRYHRLPVAVMANDGDHGRELLAAIRAGGPARRVLTCPVDRGGMPLAVERRGRLVGACHHCRACLPAAGVDTAPDIVFPIH